MRTLAFQMKMYIFLSLSKKIIYKKRPHFPSSKFSICLLNNIIGKHINYIHKYEPYYTFFTLICIFTTLSLLYPITLRKYWSYTCTQMLWKTLMYKIFFSMQSEFAILLQDYKHNSNKKI